MMKITLPVLGVALLAGLASADLFYLTDTSGKRHGPYAFRQDATVLIDGKIYTLSKDLTAKQAAVDRLKSTIIPEVSFRKAHLQDVIDFLQTATRQNDASGQGVNMVLMPGRAKAAQPVAGGADPFGAESAAVAPGVPGAVVTMSARQISLYDTLNVICDICGYVWEYENAMIILRPVGP